MKRRNKISGQFSWRLIEMIESPAYRVLSLAAHRVLDRIEIELAHHGGNDNGNLPITYADFEDYGIDRHGIAAAHREVEALGFARITERGHAGNAEFRAPNKFLLTYRHVKTAEPTDDWRKIQTIDEAKAIAGAARKNRNPVGVFTNSRRGNPHRKRQFLAGETPTTAMPGKPPLLSISGIGGTASDLSATPLTSTPNPDDLNPARTRKPVSRQR